MRYTFLLIMILMLSAFTTESDDAVVQQRLLSIQNEVPLTFNKQVLGYINVYANKKRGMTEIMLAKSDVYFPIFERILAERGLPEELKYMAVIESALNPRARSRVGATGLWQFMYSTAREYKLTINSYVDERSDVELSTVAATQYLNKMYNKYGDWLLVIASYNCGPGNVNKAIRKSGGKRDFWAIYKYLPRETRGYVPAFIAATYVMEHADVLGIEKDYSDMEYLYFEPVTFRKELLIDDLTEQLDIDEKQLKNANASLVGQIIPATYKLRLPTDKHAAFYELSDTLYASAAFKIEEFGLRKKKKTFGPVQRLVPTDPDLESIIYTVKEGDNFGFIAYWYNVGLEDLKAWNGASRNKIVIGQELLIYVHKDDVKQYANYDKLSNRQRNILASDREERMLYAKRFDNKYVYHEVKRGDTYSGIASQYDDTTIDIIKSLNNVGDRALMPGMYLKVAETSSL